MADFTYIGQAEQVGSFSHFGQVTTFALKFQKGGKGKVIPNPDPNWM